MIYKLTLPSEARHPSGEDGDEAILEIANVIERTGASVVAINGPTVWPSGNSNSQTIWFRASAEQHLIILDVCHRKKIRLREK